MTAQNSLVLQSKNFLEPNASRWWIGRVWRFSQQMFPLYPNVIIFVAQFWIHTLLLEKIFADQHLSLGVRIAGALSSVLFIYMFRVFDELKDYSTDVLNFPDRPLVKGVMNIVDAHKLWIACTVLLFALQAFIQNQIPGHRVWVSFAVVMGFSFLAFRWFFCENKIRPSLPLALITHNPILYLYQFYILSFFIFPWENSVYGAATLLALVYLVGDAMSGSAWEISRKIRGTQQEDSYTTYSKIWGRGPALALVIFFLCLSLVLSAWSLSQIFNQALYVYFMPSALVIIHLTWKSLQFTKQPAHAPVFKQWVESYKLLLLLSFAVLAWTLQSRPL